jgi:hypothetical protein
VLHCGNCRITSCARPYTSVTFLILSQLDS